MKEHEYGMLFQLAAARLETSPVCPQGHTLRRVEIEGSFPCDMCGRPQTRGDAMWACRPCRFDICEVCKHNPAGRAVTLAAPGMAPRAPPPAPMGSAFPLAGFSSPASRRPSAGLLHSGRQPEEEAQWWSPWLKKQPADLRLTLASPQAQLSSTEGSLRKLFASAGHSDEGSGDSARAWLVISEANAPGLREHDDASSRLLLELQMSDAVVSAQGLIGPLPASGAHGSGMWLALKTGDRVLRRGEVLATVTEKPVYIQACLDDGAELLRPWGDTAEQRVSIQTLSGFGIPWVVTHKSVPVRNKPSTNSMPLGLACSGDIVGVHMERGDWVQLVCSTDSRPKEGAQARPTVDVQSYVAGGSIDKASVWMLTKHQTLGQLLRRLEGEDACVLSTQGLLMGCARRGIYRRVAELCHRRIWKDNLNDLWDGEENKLPPVETIEAKFFRDNVDVLHARKAGEFKGGAILETFHIEVRQERNAPMWVAVHRGRSQKGKDTASGSAGKRPPVKVKPRARPLGSKAPTSTPSAPIVPGKLLVEERPKDEWETRTAFARIGYVHCLATEAGSRVGRALWEQICRIATEKRFLIVACHSVLQESTVDFWRSVGMRRLDPDAPDDRQLFRSQVNVCSQGSLHLEVEDLVQVLPKSALPLFIWENNAALEAWGESAEMAEPEEGDGEDEVKATLDRKLQRELHRLKTHQRAAR